MITLRTLHRRKEQGRLEPEESDRLLRLSRVFGRALELFEGDAPAAREWLARPHKTALGGERPMNLAEDRRRGARGRGPGRAARSRRPRLVRDPAIADRSSYRHD